MLQPFGLEDVVQAVRQGIDVAVRPLRRSSARKRATVSMAAAGGTPG